MNRLLTIGEVATILGVSIAGLRKWADAGQIPVTRLPGGHRRWSREQVAQIQRQLTGENEREPVAEAV